MKIVLTQLPFRSEDAAANFRVAAEILQRAFAESGPADLVVLPELIGAAAEQGQYEELVSGLAVELRSYVVGGSHHRYFEGALANCGVVSDSDGRIVCTFGKRYPYGSEVELGVAPAGQARSFELAGARVLPLICSDFWFSDVLLAQNPRPDLIAVPSFSITQRPEPGSAQALWTHMAVARAYEFATYVGISDWAHPTAYHGLPSASVAGLADPRPRDRKSFFRALEGSPARAFDLELERLAGLRLSRSARGFTRSPGDSGTTVPLNSGVRGTG